GLGRLMGRLTVIRRVNVPLEKVPRHVREAFLATEDRRFYDHNGLDWRGFIRAGMRNVGAFGVREGFSTITMQVARNTFIAEHFVGSRTLRRKLMELRLSRLIETSLTKDQILALYLNVIYLGNGMYGVEAASRDLFGKSIEDVTIAEGAVLAALPKGPSVYTPRNSPKRARARRDLVLGLMKREGYLDDIGVAAARAEPMRIAEKEWRPPQADDSYALDAVRAFVDSAVRARKEPEAATDYLVYTTLDLTAQRAADKAVRRRAAAIQQEARYWSGRNGGTIEGAMVAIDPRNGDIRALVGGRQYERGSFNRAFLARRQPGSAFKPFVYAAALAAGFTPASLVDDEPVEVEQDGRIWTPANYGDEYMGRVTMRRALMKSANAAAVRISRVVGEQRVIQAAHRNGITSPLSPVPAIALGALEVTPIELVTAYAPFANGGLRVRPRLVRRIERADGSVLWSQEPTTPVAVMDPRDAFQMTSMMRSVVDRGTGTAIRASGVTQSVAGKTGTTNNGADVWFVGYTKSLVAGFWFGYDTPHSISGDANGGRLAAPAWAEFYQQGWRDRTADTEWQPPAGMVPRMIDAETGMLAGDWCPLTQREWFKPGTEPTQICDEHYELPEAEPFVVGLGSKLGKALKKIFKF
ncbi:MAG TPA: PBP1A family penicillin-binding protein, partial [Gammaproteobacteria bacterium]|nr:PBP1A family penicillin-binding protein [Gammaproteobacteria bacterium]